MTDKLSSILSQERFNPLREFLSETDAKKRLVTTLRIGRGDLLWSLWVCRGKPFIVEVIENQSWEIYLPSSESNSTAATLASLRDYLSGDPREATARREFVEMIADFDYTQDAEDAVATINGLIDKARRLAKVCATCKRRLEVEGDPTTGDCGGDCVRCMAAAGDPDAARGKVRLFSDSAWFVDRYNKILPTAPADAELWYMMFTIGALFADLDVLHIKRTAYGSRDLHARADELAKIASTRGTTHRPRLRHKVYADDRLYSIRAEFADGTHREESLRVADMHAALARSAGKFHLGLSKAVRVTVTLDGEKQA